MERLQVIKNLVEKREATLNKNVKNLVWLFKEAVETKNIKQALYLGKQLDKNLERIRNYGH